MNYLIDTFMRPMGDGIYELVVLVCLLCSVTDKA